MSIINETRSFFLRNKQVNIGANKDREVGFPITNKVKRVTLEDGKLVEKYVDTGNRFLEGHIPSPKVWEKLLYSIVFKTDLDETILDIEELNQAIADIQQSLTSNIELVDKLANLTSEQGETIPLLTTIIQIQDWITQQQDKIQTNELRVALDSTGTSYYQFVVNSSGDLEIHSVTPAAGGIGTNKVLLASISKSGAMTLRGDLTVMGNVNYTGDLIPIK